MDNILKPQEQSNQTQCDTLNRSYTQFHHYKYGGTPEAFVLNVVGASLLIVLFSFLRRRAGDYARLALNHETWNKLFNDNPFALEDDLMESIPQRTVMISDETGASEGDYGGQQVNGGPVSHHRVQIDDFKSIDGEVIVNRPSVEEDLEEIKRWRVSFQSQLENNNNQENRAEPASDAAAATTNSSKPTGSNLVNLLKRLESPKKLDEGFFSWIWVTIRISDTQFRERIGPDAVQYLIFQRYLICITCIVCAISMFVILPVNLFGDNLDEKAYPLAYTTISNLSPGSYFLWVPSIFCIVYILLIMFLMRHFTANMPFKSQFKTNAIMITNINICKPNNTLVSPDDITGYFNSVYPEINVEVTLAYNVKKLAKYLKELEYLSMALHYCEKYNEKNKHPIMMVPKRFGVLAGCCLPHRFCARVSALDYYQDRVERLQEKVDRERRSIKDKPLGIAFAVFSSHSIARKVVDDFKSGFHRSRRSVAQDLGAEFWGVKLSPPKKDIIWENLQIIGPRSFLRGCLVNFCYVILFLFVSSPAVLLSWFETVDSKTAAIQDRAIKKSSLLSFVIPPLLFVSVAVFMPYLIFLLDDLRSHWKLSTLNLRVMTKTYIYLLFMVVILPSIGLTSIYKFIDSVVLKNEKVRWNCIFLIDNGSFFTNYVITASMSGLCMELLRVCDLILYAFRLLIMKSKAERKAAIKDTLLEFPYGFMYAYQLTVVSTVIVYSILCPLITPFGVVYMLIRHFVDRYNIYFSYAPSRISQNCHYRAVTFLVLCSMVMLLTLLAFSWLRFGKNNSNTIFLIVCCSVLLFIIFVKRTFGVLKNLTPFSSNLGESQTGVQLEGSAVTAESKMLEENLGEVAKFECPYLTFKPTWLSRQPTPTPRLNRSRNSSGGGIHTRHGSTASSGQKLSNKSFTFDFTGSQEIDLSGSNSGFPNKTDTLGSERLFEC